MLASCTTNHPPTAPARAWVTTADGTRRMQPLALSSDTGSPTVSIDPAHPQQVIDGFGAALTHSSAEELNQLPRAARASLVSTLFAPNGTVRLSILRIPIGASDFIPGRAFSLDDVPPGHTDWSLTHFSTTPDRSTLQPLLRQALALNPHLKIIASPWSPPAWLKTTDNLQGGQLLNEQRAYATYAQYLLKFVQSYRSAGIPIWGLTVQNEPQQRHPAGYPGTDMPVPQEAALIAALGPLLRAGRLATRILGFDHNWALNPADAASTPAGQDPAYDYPADLLHTPAAPWITGTAYHCYTGTAADQDALHHTFPHKSIWITECSGSHNPGDSTATVFANTLGWQATNLLIGGLANWANAVLTFNIALDPGGGPHSGGCNTCTGLVTVNADHTITRNAEFYVLAHAGRALQPGAVRIPSSIRNTQVTQVAFRNPDASIVVLAYNTATQPATISVATGKGVISAPDPPGGLLTLTAPPGQMNRP